MNIFDKIALEEAENEPVEQVDVGTILEDGNTLVQQVDEIEQGYDQINEGSEKLEEFTQVLEQCRANFENGKLNKIDFRILKNSSESIVNFFKLGSDFIVSLEDFDIDKKEVAESAIKTGDGIFKRAWQAIVNAVKWLINKIKSFFADTRLEKVEKSTLNFIKTISKSNFQESFPVDNSRLSKLLSNKGNVDTKNIIERFKSYENTLVESRTRLDELARNGFGFDKGEMFSMFRRTPQVSDVVGFIADMSNTVKDGYDRYKEFHLANDEVWQLSWIKAKSVFPENSSPLYIPELKLVPNTGSIPVNIEAVDLSKVKDYTDVLQKLLKNLVRTGKDYNKTESGLQKTAKLLEKIGVATKMPAMLASFSLYINSVLNRVIKLELRIYKDGLKMVIGGVRYLQSSLKTKSGE